VAKTRSASVAESEEALSELEMAAALYAVASEKLRELADEIDGLMPKSN
jgi:hypothetical protein